jgi:hypothetical protein
MSLLTNDDLAYMRDTIWEMFPDTCNILSEALSPDGQGGQTSTWGTVASDVSCRFDEASQASVNQLIPAGAALREVHRYVLSLPHDQTIAAHDRVEIDSSTYHVVSVNAGVSWQAVTRALLELV